MIWTGVLLLLIPGFFYTGVYWGRLATESGKPYAAYALYGPQSLLVIGAYFLAFLSLNKELPDFTKHISSNKRILVVAILFYIGLLLNFVLFLLSNLYYIKRYFEN